MFIAMNRFQVKIGSEKAFETIWATRKSHLGSMAGFVEFHLLKGPVADDHTLYSTHTTWVDQGRVRSLDQVGRVPPRPCPRRQQDRRKPLPRPPQIRGFEVIQSERKSSAAA